MKDKIKRDSDIKLNRFDYPSHLQNYFNHKTANSTPAVGSQQPAASSQPGNDTGM
jgi:hypothetical protein